MLQNYIPTNILFLDIETVPQYSTYGEVPKSVAALWEKKCAQWKEDKMPYEFYPRAGIYAEFGKIICISCGYFTRDDQFRIKSFFGHDEKQVLDDFCALLNQSYHTIDKYLCAHNGKEFDFPYLCRRMLINGIELPSILNIQGKKPWEVQHLDTMEMWKFGDYKSFSSLQLLASVFHIPTPKDDIDGSMVGEVYWKTGDLHRIVTYCGKDVLTIAQLFRRFRGEELLTAEQIIISSLEIPA